MSGAWADTRPRFLSGASIFVFTIFAALSFTGTPFLATLEIFAGKVGWFSTVDHFVSNWMLPTGGFAITLAAAGS